MDNTNDIIDISAEITKKLIKDINSCSSINKNCDYLLEHDDIDNLMEYTENLQQENECLKDAINKLKELQKEMPEVSHSFDYMIYRDKIDKILESVIK